VIEFILLIIEIIVISNQSGHQFFIHCIALLAVTEYKFGLGCGEMAPLCRISPTDQNITFVLRGGSAVSDFCRSPPSVQTGKFSCLGILAV
jgi:hypothetical protein